MIIMAALLCINAVNTMAIRANKIGLSDKDTKKSSTCGVSLNGSSEDVMLPIPKKINPILRIIVPIDFQDDFLINIMKTTPRKINNVAYLDRKSTRLNSSHVAI